jgi:predicted N-acetyltransferase YhbS
MKQFPTLSIGPLADVDTAAVEALLDAAFGGDRRQRTAYRLRTGVAAIAPLSLAAHDDTGVLIGCIQCWPVAHRADTGTVTPLVLVGPVAVAPAVQRGGIGGRLMAAMLDAAGEAPMLLIGDPEYYGRFGFTATRTGAWRLPGPFEAHRLLARGPVPRGAGDILPGTDVSPRSC